MHHYWLEFVTLLVTPFEHMPLVWGIVPLYFTLLLSESTSNKANFRTAMQTGFSFLWAAAQWIYSYFTTDALNRERPVVVKLFVTLLVIVFGATALLSGLRRRFPKNARFLGHTRFSNYFMISIFPIQAGRLDWTWDRLAAIILFAAPVWIALHVGLAPLRARRS